MKPILQVHPVRVRDIRSFNTLLEQSLVSSFDYFTPTYRRHIRHDHSRGRLLRAIISPQALLFLARLDGRPIGYNVSRLDSPTTGFIHWMYVDPVARGQGIGFRLLETSKQAMGQRGVERIRLLTHDQKEFYSRYGFQSLRKLDDRRAGVSMVLMEAVL